MKIAITATDKTPDAEVDPRFGRARFFAIFDTDSDSIEYVDNKINLEAQSGAGVQAASNVVGTGAAVVITGNCGPKAFKTLSEGNVKIAIGATGSISEVIEKFKKGEFKYAESANVEGHW
jgi:predicted Fe-Mo cluster-binding NifX family protein